MKCLGIDLGSREVKIVLMHNENIVKKINIGTMSFYRDFCRYDKKIIVDLEKIGIETPDVAISTGYGRNNTDVKTFTAINEIKAHVNGALFQTGLSDFTLIDIGGQDVKVVQVEKSMVINLELNDKCAASCGRYLENMANVLEIGINQLSEHFKEPIELNSTCSVFSESELIGKIAEGIKFEKLCAGVNYSLYRKIQPLLTKFKKRKLVLSGGVAKSAAIKKYLERDYDEVICLKHPQFNGAIGCCSYGKNKISGEVLKCI